MHGVVQGTAMRVGLCRGDLHMGMKAPTWGCAEWGCARSQAGARLSPTDGGPGVQARVVLNTSTSEGMCNSLLEAMLVGTPVLARANPG